MHAYLEKWKDIVQSSFKFIIINFSNRIKGSTVLEQDWEEFSYELWGHKLQSCPNPLPILFHPHLQAASNQTNTKRLAVTYSVLAAPKAKPGQPLLPEPNGTNGKSCPSKSIIIHSNRIAIESHSCCPEWAQSQACHAFVSPRRISTKSFAIDPPPIYMITTTL